MAHKSGNTSGVSKSSSDWLIIQDFQETCVLRSLTFLPGNKDAVTPIPHTKEESRRVHNCDDKRLSGSNKRWIFKSMWNISQQSSRHIIFKIHPRVLHIGLLLWWHFYVPKHDAEWNKLWLVVWHVGHRWALANESCQRLQTVSRQSEGLATQDYIIFKLK